MYFLCEILSRYGYSLWVCLQQWGRGEGKGIREDYGNNLLKCRQKDVVILRFASYGSDLNTRALWIPDTRFLPEEIRVYQIPIRISGSPTSGQAFPFSSNLFRTNIYCTGPNTYWNLIHSIAYIINIWSAQMRRKRDEGKGEKYSLYTFP